MTDSEIPRVLVVDDDPINRLIIANALKTALNVTEAASGEEAMARFAELRPDIILLDVVMGGIDGFTVCAMLRQRPGGATLPVVMLTALEDVDSIQRSYEVGATDFITKPINSTLLLQRLCYLLRAHETLLALRQREHQLAHAQRIARLGHWTYHPNHDTFELSPAACELLGTTVAATPLTLAALLATTLPQDRRLARQALAGLTQKPSSVDFEHRIAHPSGGTRVLAQIAEYHHDDDRGYWLGTVQDITEIRRSAQRIVSLAYYDASTRLPNRPFFVEYLQGCIDRGDAPQPGLTVLVVELETLRRVGVGWGAPSITMNWNSGINRKSTPFAVAWSEPRAWCAGAIRGKV